MTNSAGRTTLISPGTTVRGDITFTGHLDIEGEVNGSIQAEAGQDAILRIVEGGKVAGEVKVPHAMINGKVEGDIHATERLELAERAVVDGDVYYNLIEMAVGAKVNGGLRHTSNVADDLAAKREAKAAETIPNPNPHPQPDDFLILPRAVGDLLFASPAVFFSRIRPFTTTVHREPDAMTVVEAFDPNEIRLTDNAVTKVRALVEDEGNPGLKLRVYITGGGCSGFQYGFSFDEAVSEDDMIIERDGVTALIDVMSYQYLVGSEVDYSEGLEGSRFVVNNPNATTTCGCGASFSI